MLYIVNLSVCVWKIFRKPHLERVPQAADSNVLNKSLVNIYVLGLPVFKLLLKATILAVKTLIIHKKKKRTRRKPILFNAWVKKKIKNFRNIWHLTLIWATIKKYFHPSTCECFYSTTIWRILRARGLCRLQTPCCKAVFSLITYVLLPRSSASTQFPSSSWNPV